MTSTMSSSFESMDLLSSTSSMRLSHAAEELLSRCQHPENIVKRVIVAEFTTGVCLMDWKRPGVKDRGLDDHGVAALIKFFFQFGADIKGGQIRKVILEENDFEAEYFNSRKQQGSVGGTSAAASRNMFRRSVTASAESNKLHVRSRSAKDINSNKLLEQEEQQQQQQDFGGLSDRIYVQCATGNGRIIYAAVFIDGRDEWVRMHFYYFIIYIYIYYLH